MARKTYVDVWLEWETDHKRKALENASRHFDENDQRFDIDYAASAAARYLKDLNSIFSKTTTLSEDLKSIPVKNISERKKFILGAYNGGQGRIAGAQYESEQAGKNPQLWNNIKDFLEIAGATKAKAAEIREFIQKVLAYEIEFAKKSPADKTLKERKPKKADYRCTEEHWVTIDARPVFICD